MMKNHPAFTHCTLIFIIIMLFIPIYTQAQQCGYEHLNAFVLNIHAKGSNQKIKGLKIFLVDEHNKPCFSKFEVEPHEMGETWRTEYDTMLFWDNEDKNLSYKGSFPLTNLKCAGAEGYYMILIKEFEAFHSNPGQTPFYQARIVDVDGPANGGYFPTKLVRLPYGRSVNLCKTGFVEHTILNNYYHSKLAEDGNPYAPVEVILDHEQLAEVESVPEDVLSYSTLLDTIRSRFGSDSLYAVRSVVVRSMRNMKILQTIQITKPYYVHAQKVKMILKFGDFYFDNPSTIRDFYLNAGRKKDTFGNELIQQLFYTYDHSNGYFILDTLLSNYNNVEVFDHLKKVVRHSFYVTEDTNYQYLYQFYRTGWKKTNTWKTPRKNKTPNQKPRKTTECLVWLNGREHLLPRYFPGNLDENFLQVKDTYIFVNNCDDTLRLENINSSSLASFKIPAFVPPHDTAMVYYRENFAFPDNSPLIIERQLVINTPGDPFNYCKVVFVISGFHAGIKIIQDGKSVIENYPHHYGFLQNELTFDKMGKPVSFGAKIKGRDVKAGRWRYWGENGQETYLIYSKLAGITAKSKTSDNTLPCRVSIRDSFRWKNTETWFYEGCNYFWISPNTDSIRVNTDSAFNFFSVNYAHLNDESKFELMLIDHGDFYIHNGWYNVPLELLPDQYAVFWDWNAISLKEKQQPSTASLYRGLVKKYPGIVSFSVFGKPDHDAIDLSHLNETQKKQVLQKLIDEEYILKLCQVFRFPPYRPTYCDGQITLTINQFIPGDSIFKLVNRYGFEFSYPVPMSGGVYSFKYTAKLLDLEFFSNFNRLCKITGVISGSLSTYMIVEPD